jgi:hypothetical protein
MKRFALAFIVALGICLPAKEGNCVDLPFQMDFAFGGYHSTLGR